MRAAVTLFVLAMSVLLLAQWINPKDDFFFSVIFRIALLPAGAILILQSLFNVVYFQPAGHRWGGVRRFVYGAVGIVLLFPYFSNIQLVYDYFQDQGISLPVIRFTWDELVAGLDFNAFLNWLQSSQSLPVWMSVLLVSMLLLAGLYIWILQKRIDRKNKKLEASEDFAEEVNARASRLLEETQILRSLLPGLGAVRTSGPPNSGFRPFAVSFDQLDSQLQRSLLQALRALPGVVDQLQVIVDDQEARLDAESDPEPEVDDEPDPDTDEELRASRTTIAGLLQSLSDKADPEYEALIVRRDKMALAQLTRLLVEQDENSRLVQIVAVEGDADHRFYELSYETDVEKEDVDSGEFTWVPIMKQARAEGHLRPDEDGGASFVVALVDSNDMPRFSGS